MTSFGGMHKLHDIDNANNMRYPALLQSDKEADQSTSDRDLVHVKVTIVKTELMIIAE